MRGGGVRDRGKREGEGERGKREGEERGKEEVGRRERDRKRGRERERDITHGIIPVTMLCWTCCTTPAAAVPGSPKLR